MKKGLLGIAIVIGCLSAGGLTAHSKDLGGSVSIGGSVEVGDVQSICKVEKKCADGTTISCSASGAGASCKPWNLPDYDTLQCSDGNTPTKAMCCYKNGGGGAASAERTECGKFAATQ